MKHAFTRAFLHITGIGQNMDLRPSEIARSHRVVCPLTSSIVGFAWIYWFTSLRWITGALSRFVFQTSLSARFRMWEAENAGSSEIPFRFSKDDRDIQHSVPANTFKWLIVWMIATWREGSPDKKSARWLIRLISVYLRVMSRTFSAGVENRTTGKLRESTWKSISFHLIVLETFEGTEVSSESAE